MCWIPLYYRASTAPHSDQPRVSALSSYSYKGCEGSPQPQPRSPNPRPHPAFVSSSLSTPAPTYRINKTEVPLTHTCAFRGAVPSPWNAPLFTATPRLAHPHWSGSYHLSRQSAVWSPLPSGAPGSTTRLDSLSGAQLSVSPLWPSYYSDLSLGSYRCAVPPKLDCKPPWAGIRSSFPEPLQHLDRGSV